VSNFFLKSRKNIITRSAIDKKLNLVAGSGFITTISLNELYIVCILLNSSQFKEKLKLKKSSTPGLYFVPTIVFSRLSYISAGRADNQ